jgi:ectoine hydroxylase-related dioxygenase (phytanoyl-CoA dioxygenase family)
MSITHAPSSPFTEVGVFGPDDVDALESFYRQYGFALIRGMFSNDLMTRMTIECVDAQQDVLSGRLSDRYGSTVFLDEASKANRFVNYVEFVNEISPAVTDAVTHPDLVAAMHRLLGRDCWLNDNHRFGVVYQDARPGRESGYTRIGWHSDWQAAPNLAIWPSIAFTFHVDGTSPANGFLRVVPGSHLWATPAPYRNINNVAVPEGSAATGGYTSTPPPYPMALGFEKIPGEIALYTEPGDVLLHDCYLWHSAARATADDTVRRHVRGGYYVGDKDGDGAKEVFVKNAAR